MSRRPERSQEPRYEHRRRDDSSRAAARGLAAGLGVGLLNGIIVVRFGVPSLVATIGTWFFWAGIVLYGTGGKGAGTDFASGFVTSLVAGRIGGYVPAEFPWMIGIAVVLW